MKNFDEFRHFIMQDCDVDLRKLSDDFAKVYAVKARDELGLSDANLVLLSQMINFAAFSNTFILLKRYHEWMRDFQNPEELL